MSYYQTRSVITRKIKAVFGIQNMTVFVRRKKQSIQKLFYHKKYTADDIIDVIKRSGVKAGRPILVHSAFGNFYNYEGTAEELINKLLEFVGPEGTVCMPAYPKDKFNTNQIFDVKTTKSAAGYLSEVFRNYPHVYRSLNQLHSVCALGHDAEYITAGHELSRISFDKYSPFQKIAELGGYTINLGMPKWFVGTAEHICEANLYGKVKYFTEKFSIEKEFTYLDGDGNIVKHKMLAASEHGYVRCKNTKIVDLYFDKEKYCRTKLSNIWITTFDVEYVSKRLTELGLQKKTIYASPSFF